MTTGSDLRALILDAKGERSYERLSADCGGTPTAKRLQQMATGELRAFPDKESIEGIARGTGATPTAVVLAAARSLGIRVHSGEDPDSLVIDGGQLLRTDQKAALVALARSFQKSNEDQRRSVVAAALTPFIAEALNTLDWATTELRDGRRQAPLADIESRVRIAVINLNRRRQTFDEFPGAKGLLSEYDLEDLERVDALIADYNELLAEISDERALGIAAYKPQDDQPPGSTTS